MVNPQPIGEEDINEAIKAYGDNPNFLKKIIAKLPFPYNPAGLPDDVYRAIQSQYGNKIFGPYDLDKQQTVIDYYKGLGKP